MTEAVRRGKFPSGLDVERCVSGIIPDSLRERKKSDLLISNEEKRILIVGNHARSLDHLWSQVSFSRTYFDQYL